MLLGHGYGHESRYQTPQVLKNTGYVDMDPDLDMGMGIRKIFLHIFIIYRKICIICRNIYNCF